MRVRGARGTVGLPYKTIDGTAKSHKDYTPTSGLLMFKNEQTELVGHIWSKNNFYYTHQNPQLFFISIIRQRKK